MNGCSCNCHEGKKIKQCNCQSSCTCGVNFEGINRQNPCATEDLFKQFLITSLTVADPCIPDNFSDQIDCLWNVFGFQACNDLELRYLIVRREAIKILMGCAVFDIDRRDSRSQSHSRTETESQNDSRSQSQQTGFSSGYADLVGEQRYNDFADSTLRAESQRTAYSQSHDESHNRMDDTGRGQSVSDTIGNRGSQSNRVSNDHSESESNTQSDGARRGYNYQMSQSGTKGNGWNIAVLGSDRTGTKNTWDQISRSDTANSGLNNRAGHSIRTLRGEANSSSTSQRTSSSFFNALMDDRTWGFSQARAEDHSRAQSDSVSHAEGLGQSNTETQTRSSLSTQATSQSHSEAESKRDGTRNSFAIMDSVMAHQRFLHLKDLYDNTTKLIDLKKFYRMGRHGYGIGQLLTCDPCGWLNIGFAERRLCAPVRQHYCCDCRELELLQSSISTVMTQQEMQPV